MDLVTEFGPRIDPRDHLEDDRAALLRLLRDLRPDEWERPTAAAPWTVRHVVAHLLGDDLGRLSRQRDAHRATEPGPGESLAALVHRLNGEWVRATDRLSPRVLVDLLELTSTQAAAMWRGADLDAVGGAVSWAGSAPAPVWLDCAREFTEFWVHQQQIRDATGRPGRRDPAVLHVVLDTFVRAVPHTLAAHPRPDGTAVAVVVAGPGGDRWTWRCAQGRWRWTQPGDPAGTEVVFDDGDTLWRLCTRMLEPGDLQDRVSVRGDRALAAAALQIVSIIR